MARPLRIQYAGAYYHVMNRGNRREDTFITDTDRSRFVDARAASWETFSVKLIAAEHIIEEVARAGQFQPEDLLDRKTRLKELRQMAMELSALIRNYSDK